MKKLLLALAIACLPTLALAQTSRNPCFINANGGCTPVSVTDPMPIQGNPPTASAVSTPGCTVGAASAECLAGLVAARWLQLQNVHATNSIACSWGGTAVLNAAGSFMLEPGQAASWGLVTNGVPNEALNCIASGAGTPLYVEYR